MNRRKQAKKRRNILRKLTQYNNFKKPLDNPSSYKFKLLIADQIPSLFLKDGDLPSDYQIINYICVNTSWPFPANPLYQRFMVRYLEEILKVDISNKTTENPFMMPKKKTQHQNTKVDNFFQSPAWLRLRYRVLKEQGRTCSCCGATPKNNIEVHVDHIKPRSIYPKLALVYENLQILCKDCNLGKSNQDDTNWKELNKEVGIVPGHVGHGISQR